MALKLYTFDITVTDTVSVEAESAEQAEEIAFDVFRSDWRYTADIDMFLAEIELLEDPVRSASDYCLCGCDEPCACGCSACQPPLYSNGYL